MGGHVLKDNKMKNIILLLLLVCESDTYILVRKHTKPYIVLRVIHILVRKHTKPRATPLSKYNI